MTIPRRRGSSGANLNPSERRVRTNLVLHVSIVVVPPVALYLLAIGDHLYEFAILLSIPLWLRMADVVDLARSATSNLQPPAGPTNDVEQIRPADAAGSIAILYPVLFASPKEVEPWSQSLLANVLNARDAEVRHIVLLDLPDADQQVLPVDASIESEAHSVVARVVLEANAKGVPAARVAILTRRRAFAPTERRYIGRERKRGKIEDLVIAASGGPNAFVEPAADLRELLTAIVLDHGSVLDHGGAIRLHAHLQDGLAARVVRHGRVVAGFAAIKPCNRSWNPGSVPGTSRRMFLYGEDTFNGQGAFDVQTFAEVLVGKIREGRVLSHDKLEGYYLRTRYVTDVHYISRPGGGRFAERARVARWTRGDFQLLPWAVLPGSDQHPGLRLRCRWWLLEDVLRALEPAGALGLILVLSRIHDDALVVSAGAATLLAYCGDLLAALVFRRRSAGATLGRMIERLTYLVDDAVVRTGSVATAAWRMVWRYKLLDWAPTASRDSEVPSLVRTWAPTLGASAACLAWGLAAPSGIIVIGLSLLGFSTPYLTARDRPDRKAPNVDASSV